MQKCAIIAGYTQSRKTWKIIDIVYSMLSADATQNTPKTMVIILGQSNNTLMVTQVLSRFQESPDMQKLFGDSMIDVNKTQTFESKSCLCAGYWHSRTREAINEHVASVKPAHAIVVFDEADQAGTKGFKDRMMYLQYLSSVIPSIFTILVTATVANLSKSASQIFEKYSECFHRDGIVRQITSGPNAVDYHFVKPATNYVGPSYFKQHWKELHTPVNSDKSDEAYQDMYKNVCQQISANIPNEKRTLALIGIAFQCAHHAMIRDTLLHDGTFNVVLDLNCSNGKDFAVHFKHNDGTICQWLLPITKISEMMKKDPGALATYMDMTTGECSPTLMPECIPLPYILQAALMMGTNRASSIREKVDNQEWVQLLALAQVIRKPSGYPRTPSVAIVAGNMVGRGITIQHPKVGFVCTAFVLSHGLGKNPDNQRGAANCQKFGRACGMLRDIFDTSEPALLTTRDVYEDALANEESIDPLTDEHITLNTWIKDSDWKECKMHAKQMTCKKTKATLVKNAVNALTPPNNINSCVLKRIKPPPCIKDVPIVTTYTEYTLQGFIDAFNVKYESEELDTIAFSNAIRATNLSVNVSYKESSASMVSNLSNYFSHPQWAGQPYHVIVVKEQAKEQDGCEKVVVIQRDTCALDSIASSDTTVIIGGHNEFGIIQFYERL